MQRNKLLLPSRRLFLAGSAGLIASPAIVRAQSMLGFPPGVLQNRGAIDAGSSAPPPTTTYDPSVTPPQVTFSNGNLTVTETGSTNTSTARTITSHSSGKFYSEHVPTPQGIFTAFGIGNSTFDFTTEFLGGDTNAVGYIMNGNVFINSVPTTIQTWVSGNTIGVAVDITAMLIWFRTNAGNFNNSATANPATGVGGISISGLAGGPYFSMGMVHDAGDTFTSNFGATAYTQTVPSGFGNW